MSSRRTLNQSEGSSNPAKQFLTWKSNDKIFSYWDKSKEQNVSVELPIKVQFLEHFHTVKGWNDKSSSGIYSNEVKFISKEELNVKSFKGGDIASGLYKDIRAVLRDAGGKYYRSVYVINEDGEIINLQLKGACVSAYSDFMNENEGKVESYWIEINDSTDHKKGATKYSTPNFTIGKAFTKDELSLADEKYIDIANYFSKYTAEPEEKEEEDFVF
jgi:hypothetical protein